MIFVKNVSLRSFCVAIRWARRKGFPNNLCEWSQEQSDTVQRVCEEYDRRWDTRASVTIEQATEEV